MTPFLRFLYLKDHPQAHIVLDLRALVLTVCQLHTCTTTQQHTYHRLYKKVKLLIQQTLMPSKEVESIHIQPLARYHN